MRKATALVVLLAVAFGVVSCRKSDKPATPAAPDKGPGKKARKFKVRDKSKETLIAVIPKGTAHEYWQSVHAGAVKARKELNAGGDKIKTIWIGTDNESEREKQISIVNTMRNRGVHGIVLAPLDDQALRRPVADATKQGIPVVIIDSNLDSDDKVSFVATDNREGGRIAGKNLARLIGDKGKVIMLRYVENSASTENREEGFLEAIAKVPGVTVAEKTVYGGATNASAQEASSALLKRFADADGKLTIDGIFCPNASTTIGMLMALRKTGLAGKVKYVGFDATEQLIDGLRKGEIDGLVLQDPVRMGYLGVKAVIDVLDGKTVKPRIDTGVAFVTKGNVDAPAMRDVVKPDFEKWLKDE